MLINHVLKRFLLIQFFSFIKPMQYRNEEQEAEVLEWISDVLGEKLPNQP